MAKKLAPALLPHGVTPLQRATTTGVLKHKAPNIHNIHKLPRLETMFEDEGDPLEDVDYQDNDLEASATSEMSEVVRQIKERKKALFDRFRMARDPDFYVSICFQSHEQRDEFLTKSGWAVPDTQFINGLELARSLDIPIVPVIIEPMPLRGKPGKYKREEVI